MKHVGKYGGKPCIVLFREVPNEPENCLIVLTGLLESRQHDDLMDVVQSIEAQQASEINEVLNRRQFTDGSNMLSALHYSRNIQKVPVSMVTLTPTPAQEISLSDVNAEIRKIQGGTPKTSADPLKIDQQAPAPVQASTKDNQGSIAEGLLTQARLMKEDAERLLADAEAKFKEAYKLDPSLKKKKTSA